MTLFTGNQPKFTIHGLTVLEQISVDSTRTLLSTTTTIPGRMLSLIATPGATLGQLEASTEASTQIYGMSNCAKNSFVNESGSATGEYGSAKATVIKKGRVIIRPTVYIAADGSEFTIYPYDPTDVANYTVGAKLYVDATANDTDNTDPGLIFGGRLCNTGDGGKGSVVCAIVVKGMTATDPEMEVDVVCPALA